MPEDYNNLKEQVDAMQEILMSLMSNTTLPKEIVAAMKIRLLRTTGKTPASIEITLPANPAGINVPRLPDKFIKLEDGYSIPAYLD